MLESGRLGRRENLPANSEGIGGGIEAVAGRRSWHGGRRPRRNGGPIRQGIEPVGGKTFDVKIRDFEPAGCAGALEENEELARPEARRVEMRQTGKRDGSVGLRHGFVHRRRHDVRLGPAALQHPACFEKGWAGCPARIAEDDVLQALGGWELQRLREAAGAGGALFCQGEEDVRPARLFDCDGTDVGRMREFGLPAVGQPGAIGR